MAATEATSAAAAGGAKEEKVYTAGKPKKGKKQKRGASRAETKARRKALTVSWCWYCNREFGDDKVLLLHQKAKHFKCHACPRRLNTAGGLAVHLDQVHKLPAERITNAMAGRDTFDVEIYGMEGIPRDDLLDWKKRKASELGEDSLEAAAMKLNKRRIYLGPIPADELRKMLDTHRGLMSGAPSGNAAQGGSMAVQSGLPQLMAHQPPPPGLALPPGFPMPPPGFALPPGLPPPPAGFPFGMLPPGMPPPPLGFPGVPMPGAPGFIPPPPAPAPDARPPGALPNAPVPMPSAEPKPSKPVALSIVQLRAGTVMVYGDQDVSIEEKRALQTRYADTPDSGNVQGQDRMDVDR